MLLLTEYMDLRILVEEVIENFEQYTNLDSKKISEKTPSDKLTKPIEYYRNNPCGELNAGKPHRQHETMRSLFCQLKRVRSAHRTKPTALRHKLAPAIRHLLLLR